MMTSFAFIAGLIPLVIAEGAGMLSRRGVGTAVFGGMLASALVGIFLIPLALHRLPVAAGKGSAGWLSGIYRQTVNMVSAPAFARERGIQVEETRRGQAGAYRPSWRCEGVVQARHLMF